MSWNRFARASSLAVIALLASFFIINVAMTIWYLYTDPHDGQGGLAAFVLGLYLSPVCAAVAFVGALIRGR